MSKNSLWKGMSEDGQTITLHRFNGDFSEVQPYEAAPDEDPNDLIRVGAVVDLETTGFDRKQDEVIEIGLRLFKFHRGIGSVVEVGESYSGLQDPGVPIPAEITRLTGITDEMVAGQAIDWNQVSELLSQAQIVLAHNAAFDRPFLEKYCETAREKAWGCSATQVDWKRKGFPVAKLELLVLFHGFFVDSHRALEDSDAVVHLLSFEDSSTQRPYLNELLKNARRPKIKVSANQAPFETKDALRSRGYRWNNQARVWTKTLFADDFEDEKVWLEAQVYKGDYRAISEELSLSSAFRGA